MAHDVIAELAEMKPEAAEVMRKGVADTFAYYALPATRWRQIRTNTCRFGHGPSTQ